MKRYTHRAALAVTTVLALAGCGHDDGTSTTSSNNTSTTPATTVKSATVDATSTTDYRYFNLATGQVVTLTEAEAATSTAWHIAFRRSGIKLNGGTSGSSKVAGALLVPQSDFYEADGTTPKSNVFLAATAASELEHLTGTLPSAGTLTSDSITTALAGSGAAVTGQLDMGWYWYNPTTHAITVNDSNGWLLRSAESGSDTSYARVRATALSYNPSTGLDVTFAFDVQPAGTTQFTSSASFNAHVDAAGGETCFDVTSNATVACTTTTWDIKLGVSGRNWYLRSNGGVSGSGNGAAFGPHAWSDLNTYTSATTAPTGASIAGHYVKDSSSGIFAQQAWYAYNLDGTHKLHPSYRVYLVASDKDDSTKPRYALQVTSYYNDTGTSGHVSLRWRELSGN